jgi:outer membrane protein assembly factor BamA
MSKLHISSSIRMLYLVLSIAFVGTRGGAENVVKTGYFLIHRIEIRGLYRTNPSIVRRELRFKEGARVSVAQLERAKLMLRNIGLFAAVDFEVNNDILVITVLERWTVIPFFRIASGGGARQMIAGLYDINLFGRLVEAGGQYERLDQTNSGVLWFKNPRLFDEEISIFISLWDLTRQFVLYDSDPSAFREIAEYRLNRQRLSIALEKQWTPYFVTAAYFDRNLDHYAFVEKNERFIDSDDLVTIEKLKPSRVNLFGVGLRLGLVDNRNYLFDGTMLDNRLFISNTAMGSSHSFHSMQSDFLFFRTLPLLSTFGFRMRFATSSSQLLQYQYLVGGLDQIRGFANTRFLSSHYWLANIEYRIPSWQNSWFVLQNVAFLDLVGLGSKDSTTKLEPSAGSFGLGVRLLSPRVYRLNLRLDYAIPTLGKGVEPISFGVQQFF